MSLCLNMSIEVHRRNQIVLGDHSPKRLCRPPDFPRNTITAIWYALALALIVCLLLIGLSLVYMPGIDYLLQSPKDATGTTGSFRHHQRLREDPGSVKVTRLP
jgi:hypothetical protein